MSRTLIAFLLLFSVHHAFAQPLKYPPSRKVNQVDSYFGTQVTDPYRWLEADTAKDVAEWVNSQNAVTSSYLERIPFRTKLKERLTSLWNYPKFGVPFREGKRYYFFKNDGLQSQSVMYVQNGLTGTPAVFFDPNKLSTDGTVALAGFAFSKDGRYFAYGLSRSGSDWKEFRVMDASNGRMLPDQIRWAKFGSVDWRGKGFYYSAYDRHPTRRTPLQPETNSTRSTIICWALHKFRTDWYAKIARKHSAPSVQESLKTSGFFSCPLQKEPPRGTLCSIRILPGGMHLSSRSPSPSKMTSGPCTPSAVGFTSTRIVALPTVKWWCLMPPRTGRMSG